MIEDKYEIEARIAADALRDALIAVEACGADEELTKIVVLAMTVIRKQMKPVPPVVADGFPDRMPTGHNGSLDG